MSHTTTIDYGKACFDIRHAIEERNNGNFPSGCVLELSPENYADFVHWCSREHLYGMTNRGCMFMGMNVRPNVLAPEGQAWLVGRHGLIALIDLDTSFVRVGEVGI